MPATWRMCSKYYADESHLTGLRGVGGGGSGAGVAGMVVALGCCHAEAVVAVPFAAMVFAADLPFAATALAPRPKYERNSTLLRWPGSLPCASMCVVFSPVPIATHSAMSAGV